MTTQTKTFAPDYPRNEQGWLLFPRDAERRKELFPQEVFEHPAKMNLFLCQELVRYLTEPGDIVLDCFGGTGTLLIGATEGRHIILIELESSYVELLNLSANQIPHSDVNVAILPGDCRLVLPVPCDAAIFSPPYATSLTRPREKDLEKGIGGSYTQQTIAYAEKASALNLARLNPFNYVQAMGKVFKLLYESLPSGGPIAVVTKDIIKGDKRVFLSEGTIRLASKSGFVLTEWFKWLPPGSVFTRMNQKKGWSVILDEDVLILRKP